MDGERLCPTPGSLLHRKRAMTNGGRASRIGWLIDHYSLLGMAADLEVQWRNCIADPKETREALTTCFDTAIVQVVFARVGAEPADYSAAEPAVGHNVALDEWRSPVNGRDDRG